MLQNRLGLFFLFCALVPGFWGCSSTVGGAASDSGVELGTTPDVAVTATPDVPVTATPDVAVTATPDVPVTVRPDVTVTVPPPTCSGAAAESVSISYEGYPSGLVDCSNAFGPPMPGPATLVTRTAAVMGVTDDAMGSSVTLDFCSPAADCIQMLGTLRVRARGFNLGGAPNGLRRGQYVRVRTRMTRSWACTMQLEISNAPSWDGVQNAIRHDSSLLAAAASGEHTALPGAPFEVSRQSIGCVMPGAGCGARPELFALSFQGHCNTCETDPPPVRVDQGRTGNMGINGLDYLARNLRSYESGACDDSWNYAWTLREIWLE